jgi:tetratricopeptide (TPR) repeat protein
VTGTAARRQKAPSRRRTPLKELIALPDFASRTTFVARNPALQDPSLVRQLADQAREQVRVDVEEAARLADASLAIARHLGDKESQAIALRAKANTCYAQGQNAAAVDLHRQAVELFEQTGNSHELARTLSGSLQPLLLLGEYNRAFAAGERARRIFAHEKDTHRLARLEINIGNIHFRQDRFAEALSCYERAREGLSAEQDKEAIAAVLSNIATCHISLNNFAPALHAYQAARRFCEDHGMPLLASQTDYNIAYLYYLRGEYNRAIELFHAARRKATNVGDEYHRTLCDLDLAELYVELNLSSQAAELAQRGHEGFRKLRMGYESAKCLAFSAMAAGQVGNTQEALKLFSQAREIFIQENNPAWPSLIDLYSALLLYQLDQFADAYRLCTETLQALRRLNLTRKAALAQLLLGRIAWREGDFQQAVRHVQTVLDELPSLQNPTLDFQAHLQMGDIHSSTGDLVQAYGSYQAARSAFETLRSALRRDELKISFVKNRLDVYEKLVDLCLKRNTPAAREEAFGYIEQSKSRTLMELFSQPMLAVPDAKSGQPQWARSIHTVREELNWYYNRMEQEQFQPESRSPKRIALLQGEIHTREKKLAEMMQEAAAVPEGEPQSVEEFSIAEVRSTLPKDSLIVEYFQIQGNIFVCLLGHEMFEILPVTQEAKIGGALRLLQFQLAKFRLDPGYVKAFQGLLVRSTHAHLQELYRELIAPIEKQLTAEHLVFVPHGLLHYVPFHALTGGTRHLIESHTVSYAPSAGVYTHCQTREVNRTGPVLLLGIPDRRAPAIRDEVEALRHVLPETKTFLGKNASAAVLKRKGPGSRVIHVATHGYFRQDNPMFSSIRLGGSFLNLYDLYDLKLPAELITLSGCSTGLNVVAVGDELLGLVRGLLHAGAQSLVLSLWDVHDESTAEFMKGFYGLLQKGWSKAAAMQKAMLDLRSRYPHPYQWAPFFLVGKS